MATTMAVMVTDGLSNGLGMPTAVDTPTVAGRCPIANLTKVETTVDLEIWAAWPPRSMGCFNPWRHVTACSAFPGS